jgi:pimeloyl-ACP methyl ester carboxylesterase
MSRPARRARRALTVAAAAAGLVAAAVLAPTSQAGAQDTEPAPAAGGDLPIVFVHGLAGSGAQYETQAMRFASNGYDPDRIRAFEYSTASTLAVIQAATGGHNGSLTAFIDDLRHEYDADQVVLVGHSLGTAVANAYLADTDRAARVAYYVAVDGSSNANCGVGHDDLACMGVWAGGNSGNVGGNNVRLPDESHVEVATSADSFAAQYEFVTGDAPATTQVLPEPPGEVEISGRAVDFPANVGAEGATLEVWRVHSGSGHRTSDRPEATEVIGASGEWGPISVNGLHHYELTVSRPGSGTGHYYFQPFLRSNQLVRLNLSPADSPILENTHAGPDHAAAVVIRNREMWTDHPSGRNDQLTVTTTTAAGARYDTGNVLAGLTANNIIGSHLHDAEATPGESTLNPLPYFPAQPFQTGVDVYMPADAMADGSITFANTPRGAAADLQVVRTPNWPSDEHRIVVNFRDHVQEINSWPECRRQRPSPCG